MRRSDKEITDRAEIDAVIHGCDVCRLAFAVANEPYVVPLSFGYDGQHLYFHTANTGKKIDCIAANNRVCFEMERDVRLVKHDRQPCDWTFTFESVIGLGTVTEISSPDGLVSGLNHVMEHYSDRSWDFDPSDITGVRVWCLAIESLTGKRSVRKDD